jgi:hypothetical protein
LGCRRASVGEISCRGLPESVRVQRFGRPASLQTSRNQSPKARRGERLALRRHQER